MDTRVKIISAEDVSARLGGQPARWVAGHFDPLLAEHVRLLRRHSGPNQKLVVEITNPSQPLLPQKARAELVAALEMVDYVVLKSSGSPSTGALDSGITERFIQQVSRRHGGEGAA